MRLSRHSRVITHSSLRPDIALRSAHSSTVTDGGFRYPSGHHSHDGSTFQVSDWK